MELAVLVLMLAQAAAPAVPPGPARSLQPAHTGPFVALEVVQGRTSLGTITIALDKERAPVTVENFLKYVRAQHYDGTIFHRVIPNFMIQGGNFTPEMEQRPNGPAIVNEAKNGLRNSHGTVAMARTSDPNSATDQFFINLRDNHRLDYGILGAGYAVFGEVIDGMEVVDRIALAPTSSRGQYENVPEVSVIIKRAREVKAAPAPKPAAPKPVAPKP
jgi:cyclophilin family peptidyl-prolyl cis-trans isomerase